MGCERANLKVTPAELRFQVAEGWSFIPDYQQLAVDRDGPGIGAMFTISAAHAWVSFTPSAGTPPKSIRIGCRSIGFEAGVYESEVVVSSSVLIDNPRVPVVLTVTPKEEPPTEPEPPEEPEEVEPETPGPAPEPEVPEEPDIYVPVPPEPGWWLDVWGLILWVLRRLGVVR